MAPCPINLKIVQTSSDYHPVVAKYSCAIFQHFRYGRFSRFRMAYKKHPLTVKAYPAGMQAAPFSVSHNPCQENQVCAKKCQGSYRAVEEGLGPFMINPGSGVIHVEDRNPA